ncbi:MAG: GH3 auxin-responsive promoter family protein [Bacteroidetes bacterium]|nr:GH3 auxin-responsive promoter family protein [Bacteroidota bacterium]
MGWKGTIARWAAALIVPRIYREHRYGVAVQQRVFKRLIAEGSQTQFGREHDFGGIKSYGEFKTSVPIRDYEGLRHYIELIADGKEDVLWPGRPLYFCKSSGTTSGVKYIPLTRPSINAQIIAARNSLLMYVHETGQADFFDQKMIFLQGSPVLDKHGVIPSGRLSGIVYHHVPAYLTRNRMPSYETNCIEDWEQKVEAITKETLQERMSLISGIPPWVVMYFEKLLELSGKKYVKDIFPDFSVFAYGGVNYEPYRARIEQLIGTKIASIETYPASEGFIAYQDSQRERGLLLNINGGIFYEFIRPEDIDRDPMKRVSLADVEIGVNYAVILNTDAGLWGYSIGDTVRFVSLAPYRIVVTGRISHYISAFGEHVIGEEVEYALMKAAAEMGVAITEFTVAPQITTAHGELPYHEWLVEFAGKTGDVAALEERVDRLMQEKNVYYADLREGNILQQLKIRPLSHGAFVSYMKSLGKLGGQNKVPRLSNDRRIADQLLAL